MLEATGTEAGGEGPQGDLFPVRRISLSVISSKLPGSNAAGLNTSMPAASSCFTNPSRVSNQMLSVEEAMTIFFQLFCCMKAISAGPLLVSGATVRENW